MVLNAVSKPEEVIQRLLDVFPEDLKDVSRQALAGVLLGVSTQRLLPRIDRQGSVAAYGVLIPNQEIRQAIAEGKDFVLRAAHLPKGCQTLEQDIQRLQKAGIISPEIAS